jgi:hypothetical protein
VNNKCFLIIAIFSQGHKSVVRDMEPASGALIGAAALAAGAYLNAKLGIGADLGTLREEREFGERLGRRIEELGDTVTLYHMFDIVSREKEALWFEGKTWTYGELKTGEY